VSQAPQSESRGRDGRFVKGNPGGPGRPRKIVKAAADALDERAPKPRPNCLIWRSIRRAAAVMHP